MIVRSGLASDEIRTSFPSGVNFRRFAPRTLAEKLAAVIAPRSIVVMVPSPALAAHTVLPSGETSKPSTRGPAGSVVALQLGRGPARFSKIVTVPEPTFVVTSRDASGNA